MSIRIAIIGAGSLGFTRHLVHDILLVPELRDSTIALTDINRGNLGRITRILERDIRANRFGARVVSTTDRRRALAGADYVINTARVGGLEAFALDIDIPLKYGVDQCVGDTLCAGGIMYGQRGIAAMLDWCRDIREVSQANARLLNYGNPNAMLTWVANQYGGVPTVGLCHGVQHGHWQICKVIELLVNKGRKPGEKGFQPVAMCDVDIICAGINHQTWYLRALYRGEDWADRLLAGFEQHSEYRETEKVRIDVLRRFGYYSTESNGHLSEYVAWYRKRPNEIRKWIDMRSWILGETGGYLRFCTEGRNWFRTEYPRILAEKPWELATATRSQEHGSYIIEAIETGRIYRGHLNMVNSACITNLPADCIVEVPCYVDRNGISVPKVGDLPLGCAAICQQSVNVQRLAIKAAVDGNVTLLNQAMLLDPLIGAVCTPPEVCQMTDELLLAQSRWLPQYRDEIPAAKKRFAVGPRLGTHGNRGAARKGMASVKAVAARNAQTAAERRAGRTIDIAEPKG
jgi:alpha-galactosidase